MRAIAHIQSTLDVDPILHQAIDLGEEGIGVEHDAVADGAPHARMENAARNLMQYERLVTDVHGVARVRATLIAHDPIRALREDVDELSFALVAPLRSDDDERSI